MLPCCKVEAVVMHDILRTCLVQGLSRKGLHATAFEVAKLLLLLDPDDPAGALFCIDYFALRSQNLRWLHVSASECPPSADKCMSEL